jgi:hypothetical protein
MTHHVIVCGGRNFNDRRLFDATLVEHVGRLTMTGAVHLHHGDAAGADRMTDWWARWMAHGRHDVTRYPAKWDEHGRAAGPRRNAEMLAAVIALAVVPEAVTVIAFPGGSGTAHMMGIARRKGCVVVEVPR